MRFSAYSKEDGGGAGKPDIKKAVKKLRTLVIFSKQEPDPFRKKLEQTFASVYLPARVECKQVRHGGVPCDVLTPEVVASKRTIIYIHGGSFVGGSRSAWRSFCASLAAESSSKVILPEYRLAPQYAYPAALEDIQAVFRDLYIQMQAAGTSEPELIIAADGAGGSIALALIQTLKESYRQFVRNVILFSPWLDISNNSSCATSKKTRDGIICSECIKRSADLYTYESNLTNPLVSPLLMSQEKLAEFPPVYIQCGGNELLLEDIKKFYQRLIDCNCNAVLDVWPSMMFMFQMAHEYLPQAHFAVQRVGKYIQNFNKKPDDQTEPDWDDYNKEVD
ncbi:MAG: alpha/beta hydrolase [Spirochaetaceae bacterium]|nr:alpha/beta hydrolase [Spirochaetaceae bacterium]